MRRLLVLALLGAAATGCGSHAVPAGQTLAAQACQSSGAAAAADAAAAARVNPKYAGLAADEQADASHQVAQQQELSDGESQDDSGLGSFTRAESLGTSSGQQVLADCVGLGLPVTHR
jgi:hypothetical protein